MDTIDATTKVCFRCKVEMLASEFNVSKSGRFGLDAYCRTCRVSYNAERPKVKVVNVNPKWVHRLSNIDPDAKQADCAKCGRVRIRRKKVGKAPGYLIWKCLIGAKEQNGGPTAKFLHLRGSSCEICGSTKKLCIDHDHKTGAFRGTLCWVCNVSIGHMEDSPERLEAAVKYLRRAIGCQMSGAPTLNVGIS